MACTLYLEEGWEILKLNYLKKEETEMAESMILGQACKDLFHLLQTKILKEGVYGGSGLSA